MRFGEVFRPYTYKVVLGIGKIILLEKNNNFRAAQIVLNMVCIYLTNYWKDGTASELMIKISRFNHSCRPNATIKSNSKQIWAISDIQPGQEISIDYCVGGGFSGLRSKESRKKYIRQFVLGEQTLCACDLCKEEDDDETMMQTKVIYHCVLTT